MVIQMDIVSLSQELRLLLLTQKSHRLKTVIKDAHPGVSVLKNLTNSLFVISKMRNKQTSSHFGHLWVLQDLSSL